MITAPNILTFGRIIIIPFVIYFLYSNTFFSCWGALLLFVLAAFTDFFDGFIARKYHKTSQLGKFIDPMADKLLVLCSIVALLYIHRVDDVHIIPAFLILCREIFISGLREFISTQHKTTIAVNWVGKLKTTVQMASLAFLIPAPYTYDFLYAQSVGAILLWMAAGLSLFSAGQYVCEVFYRIK